MTTNSEARKRREERQANCVCNPGDHCWTCGQPRGDSGNAVRPDDSEMVEFENAKRDTVTIEISREDFKRWAKRLPLKGPNADLDNRMIAAIRHELAKVGK